MKIELKYLMRSKKIFFMLASMVVVYIIGIILSNGYYDVNNSSLYIGTNLTTFIQLFPIALIGILCSTFHKDFFERSFLWYKKNKVNFKQLLLSRLILYNIIVSVLVTVYILILFLISQFYEPSIDKTSLYLYFLAVSLASLFYTTCAQLMVSSIFKNFVKSASMTIIGWFLLAIVNGVFPFIKGYITPFDSSSIQAAYIAKYTQMNQGSFFKYHANSDNTVNFVLSLLLPIIFGLIFSSVAVTYAKKYDLNNK